MNTNTKIKKTIKKNFFTKTAALSLLSLIGISTSFANSKVIDNLIQDDLFIYHGNLKLTNSKLHNAEIQGANHLYNNDFAGPVSINGNTELKENKFIKELMVMGDIKSENNNFTEKLIINGNFKDKASHFLSDVKVTGKANFEESIISKTVEIDSNEIKISDSSAKNINFINKEDPRTVNLYLSKNTKIMGDINFSNNKGKIHLDKTVVIEGSVTGGDLVLAKNNQEPDQK